MSSDQVIGACSLDGLHKITSENKDVLIFFSKNGCSGCEELRPLITEVIKDRVPVIEAGVEDAACMGVAASLDVKMTPTMIHYQNGVEKSRIVPDGIITADGIRQKLREIVGSPLPA